MGRESKKSDQRLNAISKRIRELRIEKGFTNYEHFAYTYKLNRISYFGYESGKNMKLTTLFRILEAHDLTLDEFFEGMP